MKKALITLSLFVLAVCCCQASMVTVDYLGETYVSVNNIERTLIINSDDGKTYNIAMRPIQESITSNDGRVSIPLRYLYINNTREDVYLKYNEYSNIFWGSVMDGVPRNMTAKIKNYGIVPAGTYSILFEVQATDVNTGVIAASASFNLQFIVPTLHEINTYSDAPKITIGANDVFKKNIKIPNEVSSMVYVRSNTDWILSLDTTNFGDMAGKYYVRTTSASGGVTNRLQEQALITPGKEIILARGKAPANNEFVTVEYAVENPAKGPIKAGSYMNEIKYILREGEVN
ncbi:MAG: hypothetical protein MJ237_07305 [bacterium]|nr:hypothetical protein [bacterium]